MCRLQTVNTRHLCLFNLFCSTFFFFFKILGLITDFGALVVLKVAQSDCSLMVLSASYVIAFQYVCYNTSFSARCCFVKKMRITFENVLQCIIQVA